MEKPACSTCLDTGHVCENHPDLPWAGIVGDGGYACGDGARDCHGAGMPCPDCCSPIPEDGTRSIVEAFTPDHLRAA
jgi:bifunctional non-homologous end joining protein LigD